MNHVKPRVRFTRRRILATLALLLVFFLGVLGCTALRTCDPLRTARLSTMPLNALMEQCGQCLSWRALASLLLRETPASKDESAILHNASVEQSLAEVRRPPVGGYADNPQELLPRLNGTSLAWSGPGSPQQAKPIAWPVPESVLFLYDAPISAYSTGANAPRRIGTGFILAEADLHGEASRYLVTARHVVDPEWARCGVKNPPSITVRFNRIDGGVSYETISLNARSGQVLITSRDEGTDLALIPLSDVTVPHLKDFKLAETPFEALPSNLELEALRKEQQIVTVGVAWPKLAGLMDSPVSAPGVMATDASGAAMAVRCTAQSPVKSIHLWLIEARVELGISGAPVYAAMARGPNHMTTPVLVGIQAVVWPDRGQAGVTPIAALRDLVEQQRGKGEVAGNLRRARPN